LAACSSIVSHYNGINAPNEIALSSTYLAVKPKSRAKMPMTSVSDLRSAMYRRSIFGFWLSHCSAECLGALVEAAAACEDVMCGNAEVGKFWWKLLLQYIVVTMTDYL
jgi:hypothetical protein